MPENVITVEYCSPLGPALLLGYAHHEVLFYSLANWCEPNVDGTVLTVVDRKITEASHLGSVLQKQSEQQTAKNAITHYLRTLAQLGEDYRQNYRSEAHLQQLGHAEKFEDSIAWLSGQAAKQFFGSIDSARHTLSASVSETVRVALAFGQQVARGTMELGHETSVNWHEYGERLHELQQYLQQHSTLLAGEDVFVVRDVVSRPDFFEQLDEFWNRIAASAISAVPRSLTPGYLSIMADSAMNSVMRDGHSPTVLLTPLEYRVFASLLRQRGTYTSYEILLNAWNCDHSNVQPSPDAVDQLLRALRVKIKSLALEIDRPRRQAKLRLVELSI